MNYAYSLKQMICTQYFIILCRNSWPVILIFNPRRASAYLMQKNQGQRSVCLIDRVETYGQKDGHDQFYYLFR